MTALDPTQAGDLLGQDVLEAWRVRDRRRRVGAGRRAWRMLAIWVAVGAVLAFSHRWLWEWISFGVLAPHVLYWASAPAVLLRFALNADFSWRWKAIGLSGIWLVGLWTSLGGALNHLGDMTLLAWRLPAYERTVAAAREAGASWYGEVAGGFYEVDPGPPVRVALDRDGMGDNWTAVVWDPTGVVASARGWKNGRAGLHTATPEAEKLFGGDLVECRRLWGRYYRCSFT